MKECKHYELRTTRKPSTDDRLASAVTVVDQDGEPGYAYILFSETFVVAVGQALQRGVSKQDPAHLHVCFDRIRKGWAVNARYLSGDGITELWFADAKPDWLTIIKQKGRKNGNPAT